MARWPSGRYWTVGVIALPPEEIARRGLSFASGSDDLGPFSATTVIDSQIGEFEVLRHDESPDPGTEVRVDTSITRDAALSAVARTLGIDSRSFSWLTPYRSYQEAVVGAGWSIEGDVLIPPTEVSDDPVVLSNGTFNEWIERLTPQAATVVVHSEAELVAVLDALMAKNGRGGRYVVVRSPNSSEPLVIAPPRAIRSSRAPRQRAYKRVNSRKQYVLA